MEKAKQKRDKQDTEEKYRQLLNEMPEGIVIHEIIYNRAKQPIDYKIIEANPAFERLTGLKSRDIAGKRASKVYGAGKAPYLDNYVKVALSGKPECFETYFAPVKKYFSICVISVGDGLLAAVFTDITERKQAEEKVVKFRGELELRVKTRDKALHEASRILRREIAERKRADSVAEAQNKQLNDVLDMLPAYLVLLTPDYHVPFANRFFRERFGESHGKRCFEYLFNRTEPCEDCKTYKVLTTNASLEWEWTGPDGRNYYIYDFPFVDSDGTKLIMEVGIDITEQVKVRGALTKIRDELELRVQERTSELKESEESFRRIVETANEGIWATDPDGKTTFANYKMADMLGYNREEMIDRAVVEFLIEGQGAMVLSTRREIKEGKNVQREFQFRRKDGAVLWTLATGTALFNEDGQYVGNLYMHTDITERKKTEDALFTSEARYRRLFEAAQDGILILDADTGQIVDVNPFLVQLLGFSKEQFLDKKIWEIGLLKDIMANRQAFKKLKLKGYVRYEGLPLETSDGKQIQVEFVSNIYQVNGLKVIQCNVRDITERKKAEDALKETTDYLDNLINYANAPIIVWNPEYKITRFNRAFERLTGLHAIDVIGKELDILFPEDSRNASMSLIRKLVTGERWEVVEIPILRTDGTVRTVLWNSATITSADGKTPSATIAQGQDITELKRTQEQLIDYERLATIGKVSGSIAHEIRNPLAVIDSSIFYLKKILPAEDERVDTHLTRMSVAIHRCTSVIEALLKLTHPEEIRLGSVSLKELVDQVLLECAPATLKVVRQYISGTVTVSGDAEQLRIACHNIITNAIQAMPDGGTLTVMVSINDNSAVIAFSDTGTGIPPENLARIFEPLFTTKAKGTGLGLSIAKAIVELHHGTISATSEPGKGATFTIQLPL